MKTKRGWVILGLLALILLTVQVRQNPADQAAPGKAGSGEVKKPDIPDQWSEKVKMSPGIDPKWSGLISLGELVKKDIVALEASFAKGDLKGLVGLLAIRSAVVSGFDYELESAGDSFGFWKAVRTPGSRLELRVVSAYVSNAPGPHPKLPLPPGMPPYKPVRGAPRFDSVAFVAFEIHVIAAAKAGEPVHNDTYFMDLGYRHQWCCVWGEEEDCLPPPLPAPVAQ